MSRKVDLQLCVITDAEMVANRSIEQVVLSAIQAGATLIQYREKVATMREKYERATELCRIVKKNGVPFIVNDHTDLALAVDADGVHLGQDDLPVSVARRILGEGSIVGVSVGSVVEALLAESEGADYVSVGPLYPTRTKSDAGTVVSREVVKEMVEAVEIPVIAIGGIDASNVLEVMRLGVSGIAVVSAIMLAEDPALATRDLVDKVSSRGAGAGEVSG